MQWADDYINRLYVFEENGSIYIQYIGRESDITPRKGFKSPPAISLNEFYSKEGIDTPEEVESIHNKFFEFYVDLRIKQINLPNEISDSIYQRMRAERETVARKHRSQGREKAEVIRAQAELEVAKLLAEADRIARVTRGDADAESAKIYANAYNKEPEFFNFIRSLEAYEKSFSNKGDILVLDPKTDFFKYMNNMKGTAQ